MAWVGDRDCKLLQSWCEKKTREYCYKQFLGCFYLKLDRFAPYKLMNSVNLLDWIVFELAVRSLAIASRARQF